ncbi:PREDICTED: pro-resilin-like [Ceratosolen solmsi marchali]|uniref:Pro-resilin-like n=1 Tax=Ceratosolen solmsi marchali TaxID=326594 RepID=A0AAJ7DV12_9HYME|nr:PREDICTED: pro-resilin-like [Ceratosolen solmsi marchali]
MDTVVRKMVAVMALCVSLSRCEPLALSNQYGVPGNFVGNAPQGNQYQQQQTVTNSYGAPLADGHGHDEHQDYIDSQPKSYEFGYAVRDAASGNDFGRRETSDGETVRGEYRVQLPDGRTQIVTYTADWRTGFHADVRYEGVAQFPDQYNTGNQGYNNNANNANNNAAYDYVGNNIDSAYNNVAGNRGGYNNYQSAANNYNSGSNYNYQYGSNSVDSGYSSGNSFGPSVSPPPSPPQPTYGVPFH